MYLSHYNLRLKPFQITTDPRFIWLGEKHDEALATLIYGIQEDKGFLVLTGEIGTGKTSLINYLLKKLDYKVINATISDPAMSINDFFKILSDEFNMDTNFEGKGDFLIHFKKFPLFTSPKNPDFLTASNGIGDTASSDEVRYGLVLLEDFDQIGRQFNPILSFDENALPVDFRDVKLLYPEERGEGF